MSEADPGLTGGSYASRFVRPGLSRDRGSLGKAALAGSLLAQTECRIAPQSVNTAPAPCRVLPLAA